MKATFDLDNDCIFDRRNLLVCSALCMLVVCNCSKMKDLKAFSMDNSRSGFVVFLFRDPHLLEG